MIEETRGAAPAAAVTDARAPGAFRARAGACLVVVYYLWTASSSGNAFSFGAENRDYYNLLVDGLFAGRLSLLVQPDPELLALPDPYDPVANARFRLPRQTHDLSLFEGRYYLYFGLTPALLLFAPVRLLGARLPENLAAALLFAGGFAGSLAIFEARLRDHVTTPFWRWLGVLALGFGTFAPYLLRRPLVYEVAIAGGYCVAAWGVFFASRALRDGPRTWLMAAGLLLGLAIGSRPIQVVGAALVGVAVFVRARRAAFVFFAPLGLVLVLLGAYNALRFGSPIEFGIRHQLTEWNQRREALFSTAYLWPGLWLNLVSPARLQPEFPFFALDPSPLPAMPAGHFAVEPIAGLLACAPVAGLGLAWPWLLLRRRRLGKDVAPALAGCAFLAMGLSLAAGVSAYAVVSARYVVDFAPWMLLAGMLAGVELAAIVPAGARRSGFSLLVGLSVAYTTVLNAAIGLTGYYDWMKRLNPSSYERLERLGLGVQRLWLAVQPGIGGPVRLELELPRAETEWQTLLAAGGLYRHDVVCIRRLEDERVQLRFHHRGFEPVRSRPLPVPDQARLVVEVAMGSLYPVNARVLARLYPEADVAARATSVRIRVAGLEALKGEFDFIPSAPRLVTAGRDPFRNGQCDEPFSGRIVGATRLPILASLSDR